MLVEPCQYHYRKDELYHYKQQEYEQSAEYYPQDTFFTSWEKFYYIVFWVIHLVPPEQADLV